MHKIVIPGNWRNILLSEIAEIKFSTVDKKNYKNQKDVLLCNYKDVYYNDRIISTSDFMPSTASDSEVKRYRLEKDDVVFTKDSETPEDIGICTYIEENIPNLVCGYHLGIARPNSKMCLGQYLYFSMNFHPIHHQLVRAANGVTRYGLTLNSISQIYIPLPPLDEQRKIAKILRTWDEAIEKQIKIIYLLQKKREFLLAKLLYGCKTIQPINFFAKPIVREVSKPTESYYALGIRCHCKGTFKRFIKDVKTVEMKILYQVRENDLIVNITFAWEGAITLVKKEDEHCLVSHRFPTYEIDTSKAVPHFIRHTVQTKRFIEQLGTISPGGAGRNRVLSKKDFLELKICLPDLEKQKYVANVISTIESEIESAQLLLESFKKQKRGLMQKLLTGQWRVKTNEMEAA